MSTYESATVTSVKNVGDRISEAGLEMDSGATARAVVLEQLVGTVEAGDLVVVNTTAVELSLGSGGYHYVVWNLSRRALDTGADGHIMKLRYTPLQVNVEAAEESLPYVQGEDLSHSLAGVPVVAGEVHSQLLAAAVAYRHASPTGRLVYVMTDGGALPASFSRTVAFLVKEGYLASVITSGHAFGGDLEAVNLHGALLAAKRLQSADAVVALMGPGIVGTGSALGFTGMEQGDIINAAASLGGVPVAIPRITFGDARERHNGLSHHTVSALKYGARTRSLIALPSIDGEKGDRVWGQLAASGLDELHEVREIDAAITLRLIEECGFPTTVMGRGIKEEPEFFMAAGAAGLVAAAHGGD